MLHRVLPTLLLAFFLSICLESSWFEVVFARLSQLIVDLGESALYM
jgi:hypothetical protein